MKEDKPYGDIRHEAKVAHMKKYEDPVGYATDKAIKTIDEVGEIKAAIQDLTDSYKYQIDRLKGLILDYFCDNLQRDETAIGAMKRNQIRKELLDFASR
jgi:hypothetical protein